MFQKVKLGSSSPSTGKEMARGKCQMEGTQLQFLKEVKVAFFFFLSYLPLAFVLWINIQNSKSMTWVISELLMP